MTNSRPLDDRPLATTPAGMLRVVLPPEHQGVVNALRNAYPCDRPGLPADLAGLLDRLR